MCSNISLTRRKLIKMVFKSCHVSRKTFFIVMFMDGKLAKTVYIMNAYDSKGNF